MLSRTPAAFAELNSLAELEEAVERVNLTPGWLRRSEPIIAAQKWSSFQPSHWCYTLAREALDAGARLIDLSQAERRNLLMRNPIENNAWPTSRTLNCAYQMILPGETARSHRHSCNALRVIIDGKGSFSIVSGDKMPMETGDVVLTPGRHWHAHGLDGEQPAYWLDCLDVPLGHLLEFMYFNDHPDGIERVARVVEDSPYRFSRAAIASTLDAAAEDPDGRYGPWAILPTPSMPSTGLIVHRLSTNAATRRRRTSANRILSIMAGRGHSEVGSVHMSWQRGDTLVIPSGVWFSHQAISDAQIIEMTDEPLLRFANHFVDELA